jgi:hypothetical protein
MYPIVGEWQAMQSCMHETTRAVAARRRRPPRSGRPIRLHRARRRRELHWLELVGVARRRRRSSWRRRDEPPAVDMGPLLTSEEKAKGECGL